MLSRLLLALAIFCAADESAFAQSAALTPEQRQPGRTPGVVDLANRSGSAAVSAEASALLKTAAAAGRIRVIAGLNLNLHASTGLSGGAAIVQARALNAAQDRVIARTLGVSARPQAVAKFRTIPFVSIFVTATELQRLLADPEVIHIQHDVPLRPTLLESVPRINADDVWAAGVTGRNSAVAVLDTGVAHTHPMLSGKLITEGCYSTEDPSLRVQSLCPGRAAASTDPGSGLNCTGVIGCEHGTHVAAIAVGRAMPGSGETGVAKDARLIAIKVFSRFARSVDCSVGPPCLGAYITDVIKGLERVYEVRVNRRIAAVNLSLGGGYPQNASCDNVQPAMTAIIKMLRAVRIPSVIAAGNSGSNGTIFAPACISAAIAVGSSLDTADTMSAFSSYAPHVRLVAPGSNIRSAILGGAIGSLNGTSMATPHVAGAFALLRDTYPAATVDDISAALECTGTPIERAGIVRPRIDVAQARPFLLNPPNALRFSDFVSGESISAWTPFFMGNFITTSGVLRATVGEGWKIAAQNNCNENVVIEARMLRVDADTQGSWNTGIFFKSQLNPATKTFSGYFAGFNDFYGGQVFLNRLHHFNLNVLFGGYAHNLCAVKRKVTDGVYNTLRVESTGGVHRVYFNGALACRVMDQTFGVGKIAVASYFPNPSRGHTFQVDSVLVDPNEAIPVTASSARIAGASK